MQDSVKQGYVRARKPTKVPLVGLTETCPPPAECKDKLPEKYEDWGKHELPIKKWCHLADHIEELLNAEVYQITVVLRKRIDLPSSLVKYEVGEFQFMFQGERVVKKRTRAKKERTTKTKIYNWRYRSWEHKEALDQTNVLDEERQEYYGRVNKTDTWEGNDLTTTFKASACPIEPDSEEVYVDEVIMHKGVDYTIDYSTGEITFMRKFSEKPPRTAPPLLAEVKVTYTGHGKREPGHPTEGAILEDSKTGFREKEIIEKKTQYEVGTEFKWEHKPHYNEVAEERFELSKEEALHYFRLFTEVVKKADMKRYKTSIKTTTKIFEDVENWIESWVVPFPSRRLTRWELGEVEGSIELGLECPAPDHVSTCIRRIRLIQLNMPYFTESDCNNRKWRVTVGAGRHLTLGKKKQCPRCLNSINPKVTNLSWDEDKVIVAVLEVDDMLENTIRDKMKETYEVSPLIVNFNLDIPKPGQTATTTEKEALHDIHQLDQVAKELAKHLRAIEICGATPRLIVRGYADSSHTCRHNFELSERRAQWVVDKLGNKLRNRFGLKLRPEWVQIIKCGKTLADDKRPLKDRWKDRAVIIELDAEEGSSEESSEETAS